MFVQHSQSANFLYRIHIAGMILIKKMTLGGEAVKRLTQAVRILMCIAVSFYTVYLCGHIGYAAYMKGYRITVQGDDGYGMVRGVAVEQVGLTVLFAVLLLLLGVACILLLFRRSRIAAVGACACAVVGALLGGCFDTRLSEFMMMRYVPGLPTALATDLAVSLKPLLAALCIGSAVLYLVLYWVTERHGKKMKNEE